MPDPEIRKRLHDANPKAFPNGGWFAGDNVNLAIGQGEMVVTPLQLANAYATFANGGTVFQPRIADKGRSAQRQAPGRSPRPQPIHTSTCPAVGPQRDPAGPERRDQPTRRARPTAHSPASLAFPVAGKTGTAQVFGKQDTALFASFAPANDPQYVVAVVMEESGFGGAAAAPVARRIYEGLAGQPPAPVSLPAASTDVDDDQDDLSTRREEPGRGVAPPRHEPGDQRRCSPSFGVVMVYSATPPEAVEAGLDPAYFLKRQAAFVVVGVVVMALVASIDYRIFRDYTLIIYPVMVFVLLAVLTPLGSSSRGHRAGSSSAPSSSSRPSSPSWR